MRVVVGAGIAAAAVSAGCSSEPELEGCTISVSPGADDQTTVQTALIEAQPGDVVCFERGRYSFTDEVSLAVDGVTLKGTRGAIWDFSGQLRGANGLHILADDVTVEGFTVLDTEGDGIRATNVRNLVLRGLEVGWTTPQSNENGGYALYPVESENVLIEDNVTYGASDLGIYLGQTNRGVIRNNEAYDNVAGIEAENSFDVDIYGNYVHDNASGIQAFTLPELPMKQAARIRIFDNVIDDNNGVNFAPSGSIAFLLPEGTGVLIMAADRVEVFDNVVTGNKSIGIGVVSYEVADRTYDDPEFDTHAEGNFVHDNDVSGNGLMPDGRAIVVVGQVGPIPQLIWDGVDDPGKDNADGSLTNCFRDNGDADYLNFDYEDRGTRSTNLAEVTCAHEPLPPVSLPF